MDTNQIAQMIEWLDEERRRDKALIATLEERLAQQQQTIDTMSKRVNSVESDQTVMKEAFVPSQREHEIMDNLRKEMRQLLETGESRRLTAEREADRRHELSREALQRDIKDISEKLTKLERQSSTVAGLQTEGGRLADTVAVMQQQLNDIEKRFDEPDRRLAFLEEQRRQDAKRLSEIESELPEQRKQIDTVRPKVTLIEDLALRNERRVQEQDNLDRERRDQMQQFIDQQNLITQQRDQQINDITSKFGEHEKQMLDNIERFETWSQAYRDMKRIIDDFERIGDRLERRINEVAEMQRLSEDRFRQEWNDWRDDSQKRWKQLTLSNDEVWRNHDKEFSGYVSRLEELEVLLPEARDSIQRLWTLERKRADLYRERYSALISEYDMGDSSSTIELPAVSNENGSHENGNQ